MLYIKENSLALIAEYLDDIKELEAIKSTSISHKDFIEQLIQNMQGHNIDFIEAHLEELNFQFIHSTEQKIRKMFMPYSSIFLCEAVSTDDLIYNIQMTIDGLTNRIMAILKRSR